MTEQQIIETLATKVMGWHKELHFKNKEDQYGDFVWCDAKGETMVLEHKWNPLQNIVDAWVLVDKIGPFEYRKSPIRIGGGYQHIAEFFYRGNWYSGEGTTVQEAICQAALKAVA